jgi:hypothetical protein
MATDTKPRTPGTPQRTRPQTGTTQPQPEKPHAGQGRQVSSPRHTRPRERTEGRGAAWTEERRRSDEGRQHLGAPRGERANEQSQHLQAPGAEGANKQSANQQSASQQSVSQQRMPFILLLVGLLGGALVSLLVISTTLAQGAFQITSLQQQNTNLARQEQTLTDEVAQAGNPSVIASEASQLGMRQDPNLKFIDTKTGKIVTGKVTKSEAAYNAPGYTP